MLGIDHKNCVGSKYCEYYFCTHKNKCLWTKRVFPEVKFVNFSPNISKMARRLIQNGHKPECACCGSIKDLTFDHIIPVSKGGHNGLSNGQILCKVCNNKKGNRDISLDQLRKKVKNIHFFTKRK